MNWCDPCAADPLTAEELRSLGVFWIGQDNTRGGRGMPSAVAQDVYVSRLHVRYNGGTFPEDLTFQSTGDRTNYQGRYILQHPFEGATCSAADKYYEGVAERQETEAKTLADLTGRDLASIRKKMKLDQKPLQNKRWWEKLWE